MNTTRSEKSLKKLFVGKCWEYLNNNFHKFSETNKIKIALELCKKDVPQILEGSGENPIMVMPTITVDGKPKEFSLGSDPNPPDS